MNVEITSNTPKLAVIKSTKNLNFRGENSTETYKNRRLSLGGKHKLQQQLGCPHTEQALGKTEETQHTNRHLFDKQERRFDRMDMLGFGLKHTLLTRMG